jgi:plasmid maintenance system antidote protein VapI
MIDVEQSVSQEIKLLRLQQRVMATITALMKKHDLTRYQLSRKLGIEENSLSRQYTGERHMTMQLLVKLQDIFDVEFSIAVKLKKYTKT